MLCCKPLSLLYCSVVSYSRYCTVQPSCNLHTLLFRSKLLTLLFSCKLLTLLICLQCCKPLNLLYCSVVSYSLYCRTVQSSCKLLTLLYCLVVQALSCLASIEWIQVCLCVSRFLSRPVSLTDDGIVHQTGRLFQPTVQGNCLFSVRSGDLWI